MDSLSHPADNLPTSTNVRDNTRKASPSTGNRPKTQNKDRVILAQKILISELSSQLDRQPALDQIGEMLNAIDSGPQQESMAAIRESLRDNLKYVAAFHQQLLSINKSIGRQFGQLADLKESDLEEEKKAPALDESEFQNISIQEEDIDEHIACQVPSQIQERARSGKHQHNLCQILDNQENYKMRANGSLLANDRINDIFKCFTSILQSHHAIKGDPPISSDSPEYETFQKEQQRLFMLREMISEFVMTKNVRKVSADTMDIPEEIEKADQEIQTDVIPVFAGSQSTEGMNLAKLQANIDGLKNFFDDQQQLIQDQIEPLRNNVSQALKVIEDHQAQAGDGARQKAIQAQLQAKLSQGTGSSESFRRLINLMKDGDLLLPRNPLAYFNLPKVIARAVASLTLRSSVEVSVDSLENLGWTLCMEGDQQRYLQILKILLKAIDLEAGEGRRIKVLLKYKDQIDAGGGGGADPFAMMMGGGGAKEPKESKTKIDPASLEEGQDLEGKDNGEEEVFIQADLFFEVDPPIEEHKLIDLFVQVPDSIEALLRQPEAQRSLTLDSLHAKACQLTVLDMGGALEVEKGLLKWNLKFKSQQRQVIFNKAARAVLNPEEAKDQVLILKREPGSDAESCLLILPGEGAELKSGSRTPRAERKQGDLEPCLEKRRSSLQLSSPRQLEPAQSTLAENIDFLFNPQPSAIVELPPIEQAEGKKFRALVANDEAMQLTILKTIFSGKGFDCTAANNGYEAFFHAREAFYGEEKFDIIVLDLNMPVCSGYEACEKIVALYAQSEQRRKLRFHREWLPDEKLNARPLIMACSSHVDDEVIEHTRRIGFNLTLPAPLNAKIIEEKLKLEIIENRVAHHTLVEKATAPQPSGEDPFPTELNYNFENSFANHQRDTSVSHICSPEKGEQVRYVRPPMQDAEIQVCVFEDRRRSTPSQGREGRYSRNSWKVETGSQVQKGSLRYYLRGMNPSSQRLSEPYVPSMPRRLQMENGDTFGNIDLRKRVSAGSTQQFENLDILNSSVREESGAHFPRQINEAISNKKSKYQAEFQKNDCSSIKSIECELTDEGSDCKSVIEDAMDQYNSIFWRIKQLI